MALLLVLWDDGITRTLGLLGVVLPLCLSSFDLSVL